jgi:hypothetical protein
MEITFTELALFVWGMVSTLLWAQAKANIKMHRMITGEVFMRIARGEIKVTETKDSFEIEEVKP